MIAHLAIETTGRDAAVRYLVANASRRAFAIAVDLVGGRAEAEDVVQDALVRTLDKLHQIRDEAALEAWFLRIVANRSIAVLRKRRVRAAFARIVRLGGEPEAPPPAHGRDHVRLMHALDELPAMQKSALVLRYGHDLGEAEIAKLLDVSPETVKTHLKRGRERLRKELS